MAGWNRGMSRQARSQRVAERCIWLGGCRKRPPAVEPAASPPFLREREGCLPPGNPNRIFAILGDRAFSAGVGDPTQRMGDGGAEAERRKVGQILHLFLPDSFYLASGNHDIRSPPRDGCIANTP